MTHDKDPIHIIPTIASALNVAHHLVSGSIENNGDEIHVSVADPKITNEAIQALARQLGGNVMDVDIERDQTTTDFIVHDSSVVKQRLAKAP
jgi:hypothetical protein